MSKRVTGTTYERVDTISAWVIEGGHLNQLMELAPKLNRTLTPDEKRDLQNLIFLIVTNATAQPAALTPCGELGGDF